MTFTERTDPSPPARKRAWLLLAAILLVALALRLWRIDFGLPSLNDPDEPVFVMTALDMLREGRLNPGWFGHPATLLFYLLVIVIAAVAGVGAVIGAWPDTAGFVAAVFADPAIVALPMRAASAILGVVSVWLTWRIGRRVADDRTALAAALLLAACPLHIELSQVIRTDMLATVLMGWSLLHALAIARGGGVRDHLWAGVAAGLACATKWPAVLVLVAPVAAGLWRAWRGEAPWRLAIVAPLVAVATLVVVSPYLLLDYPTVLRDLGGEARPAHLGATGHGLIGNLGWYVRYPLYQSFGLAGLALIAVGIVGVARNRAAAIVLLPTAAILLLALAAQSLVWARWIVPLLPIAALLVAIGVRTLTERRHPALATAVVLLLSGWMASVAIDRAAARADDPRQRATAWVLAHVPPGRTILVEHAAFDLMAYRGTILFPLGAAGCVDVRRALARAPSHRQANQQRTGRAIVDLGNVDPAKLSTCDADVAILTNHARYRRADAGFAGQRAIYNAYLRGRESAARFAAGPAHPDAPRTAEVFLGK